MVYPFSEVVMVGLWGGCVDAYYGRFSAMVRILLLSPFANITYQKTKANFSDHTDV